jgi:hypothetical protein
MPGKRNSRSLTMTRPDPRAGFGKRYTELESARETALARLERLGDFGKSHPAYPRVRKLLTNVFRKATIAQRAAVLQAADWMIRLIEGGGGGMML